MTAGDLNHRKCGDRARHFEELMEKLELIAVGPVPMEFSTRARSDEGNEKILESVLASAMKGPSRNRRRH